MTTAFVWQYIVMTQNLEDTSLQEYSEDFNLVPWFPPGLENRENLEKREDIFQSGNFTQNTGKIRKNYTGKLKKILKKSGKLGSQ